MGTIKVKNGYLLYSIEEDCIILDKIKVYNQRQGTGSLLIKKLKEIAAKKSLRIELYAYPQDDTSTVEELQQFYSACGFDLDPDDVDGCMFVY